MSFVSNKKPENIMLAVTLWQNIFLGLVIERLIRVKI